MKKKIKVCDTNLKRSYGNNFDYLKKKGLKELIHYRDRIMNSLFELQEILNVNYNNLEIYYYDYNVSLNNLLYLEMMLNK